METVISYMTPNGSGTNNSNSCPYYTTGCVSIMGGINEQAMLKIKNSTKYLNKDKFDEKEVSFQLLATIHT